MEPTPSLSPDAVQVLNWLASVSYKDAGTTAGAQLHGPGSLLGFPGLNKQIINAMIMPEGIAGRIPVMPSVNTNELFPVLTGQLASTGTEPTEACAEWPMVGSFKTCVQTFPFGQQGRESQVLNIKYAGQVINRGEFRDNVLLGKPGGNVATPGPINWQRVFQTEYEYKLGELFNGYARDYAPNVYTGDFAVTAGSLGYQQYNGLNKQVKTDKVDARTGQRCAAVDSLVIDFNGLSINSAGGTIYALLANAVNNMERLAKQLGLSVEWALTIRFGAWQVLTSIWPCIYATTGCPGGTIVRTSSLEEQVKLRDEIRNSLKLPIEGKYYEVIIDDTIPETIAAGGVVGTYQSDMYLLPLKVNGQPALYWEYFPFNAEATAAASRMAPTGYFEAIDNGRFLLSKLSPTHTCIQVEVVERPRLILLTPFLAARFQNLSYTYSIHEREWDPANPYFVNGGVSANPLPYFYPNS